MFILPPTFIRLEDFTSEITKNDCTLICSSPSLDLASARALSGYLFLSPWFIRFLIFTAGPLIVSLALSFTSGALSTSEVYRPHAIIEDGHRPGLLAFAARHRDVYGAQRAAGDSYRVDDGMLMTRKLPGMHIYRAIYYLPAIVGGVADGADRSWVFQPDYGILNRLLFLAGLPVPTGWAAPSGRC